MRLVHLAALVVGLSGCFRVSDAELAERMDVDKDGVDGISDCDDADGAVGMPSVWYADGDGDGFGSEEQVVSCEAPEGYVAQSGDCDDTDPARKPGAVWFQDDDGDGFGQADSSFESCAPPAGYASLGTDCDDARADVSPDAAEVCDGVDNDCDNLVDTADSVDLESIEWYRDGDGDGHGAGAALALQACELPGYQRSSDDCDDDDAAISPDADEECNGIDDDCDGLVDDADTELLDPNTFYADADADGFGTGDAVFACLAPAGHTAAGGDCDDSTGAISPGALEVCDGVDNDCDGQIDDQDAELYSPLTFYLDLDQDGYGTPDLTLIGCSAPPGYILDDGDCDDRRADVSPAAAEVCDGIDNDCDGIVDNNSSQSGGIFYPDADGDGFGVESLAVTGCVAPEGTSTQFGDCDDSDPSTYPGATETCDLVDNNCNGLIDELVVDVTWYADADGDGYGDSAIALVDCAQPAGYVQLADDCDDNDATIHPNATEICDLQDNDCDGLVDDADSNVVGTAWYADADADGYGDPSLTQTACAQPPGHVDLNTDCDDQDASINPGMPEICNSGVDDDCDRVADDLDSSLTSAPTWYADTDADTYGDPSSSRTRCVQPANYVADSQDCEDRASANGAAIHPGAAEICNSIDDNCDTLIDDADPLVTGQPLHFADADGDTYGDPTTSVAACVLAPGIVDDSQDCDDTSSATHPGAVEICDLKDNDCNGLVDDNAVPADWYPDGDGDGHGDPNGAVVSSCSAPVGMVLSRDDCDDTNPAVHPGAAELCATVGVDDDCDGAIDENTAVDVSTWYLDGDADSYGISTDKRDRCVQPAGYVLKGGGFDCNDVDPAVNPGATEICNSIDDDCDNLIDDADRSVSGQTTWHADNDGDTFGSQNNTQRACVAPPGMIADGQDCNDNNPAINPAADELCATNGVDDNCDGRIDDSTAIDPNTYYRDNDGDNYGDPNRTSLACNRPRNYVTNPDDCDDTDRRVNPSRTEQCNGIDDDCNGLVDDGPINQDWFPDVDGDSFGDPNGVVQVDCSQPAGMSSDNTDCDDADPAINPAAADICDGLDNDCSGLIDDDPLQQPIYYLDGDGDLYGDPTLFQHSCVDPGGQYLLDGGDCDDNNAAVHPFATDVCDGVDNDCDTRIDEYCLLLELGMSAADWTIDGGRSNRAYAGSTAVGMDDLDGTPGVEIAVGAPGRDEVYILASPGNQQALFRNVKVLQGNNDLAGTSLAWHPTYGLAVGAPAMESNRRPVGGLYLLADPMNARQLSDGVRARGRINKDDPGTSVAFYNNAGGVESDTLVTGAPAALAGAGQVIFLDPVTPSFGWSMVTLDGDPGAGLGTVMARVPDLTGDGVEDLVVTATTSTSAGEVFVVPGGLALGVSTPIRAVAAGSFVGANPGDLLGSGVAAADVDGDGNADLLLGAPGANGSAGAVYVVYGPLTKWGDISRRATTRIDGANLGDQLGASLSAGFDIDDDTLLDIAMGAPGWDQVAPTALDVGAGYLLTVAPQSGQNYLVDDIATVRYGGLAAGDAAGSMVCEVGDMSGDGLSDWVIGAPMATGDGQAQGGQLYLFYGPVGGF